MTRLNQPLASMLERRALQAVQDRVAPGGVIGVRQKNGNRLLIPFGRHTYEEHSPLVHEESLYDLASVTKSIPTASLALIFAEQGKFQLRDQVKKFIPELQHDHGATIEDLLRYRVKGPRMSTLRLKTFEEIRTHIFEHGFDGPPGESCYTNLPAYLLGVVLERISKTSLALLGHKYFFEPLSMKNTTFFPATSDCAPTEIQDGETIQGIAHDESARVFARARRTCGHAGLFSTAPDLLNFAEALMRGDFPAILKGAKEGLGWQTNSPTLLPKGVFGKTGFTGTLVAIDAMQGVALVIVTNRTFPRRADNSNAINELRKHLADMVF